jgi:hypothetical protein
MSRTQHFSGQPGPLSRTQSPVDTAKALQMAHYGTEGQRFESSRAHYKTPGEIVSAGSPGARRSTCHQCVSNSEAQHELESSQSGADDQARRLGSSSGCCCSRRREITLGQGHPAHIRSTVELRRPKGWPLGTLVMLPSRVIMRDDDWEWEPHEPAADRLSPAIEPRLQGRVQR